MKNKERELRAILIFFAIQLVVLGLLDGNPLLVIISVIFMAIAIIDKAYEVKERRKPKMSADDYFG